MKLLDETMCHDHLDHLDHLDQILIILIIWSGLVWSAGQHLLWDEAVLTSVANKQTNKQTTFQL